jgi:hypothetical protein
MMSFLHQKDQLCLIVAKYGAYFFLMRFPILACYECTHFLVETYQGTQNYFSHFSPLFPTIAMRPYEFQKLVHDTLSKHQRVSNNTFTRFDQIK